MANDLKILNGKPLSENLSTITVDEKRSSLEVSEVDSGARVRGDLEVTDDITCDNLNANTISNFASTDLIIDDSGDITLDSGGGQITFTEDGATDKFIQFDSDNGTLKIHSALLDYFTIDVDANAATSISTTDTGSNVGHLTITADGKLDLNAVTDVELDATGDIILDSADGNITLLDGGSTYTPTSSSDAVTKTYNDTHTVINNTVYSRANNTTWYLFSGNQNVSLGGTDTSVDDFEDVILSRNLLETLWFIVPYNITVHAISGSVSDDDMSAHLDKNIGIWTVDALSTSGNDPGNVSGSQRFTLRYITASFGGGIASSQSFHDTGADFALTAGQGVFLGYINGHSGGLDEIALNCTIWAHQTTP